MFRKEIGTISSRELYKFFDKEGNTLALRPDITPSIARAAATLFGEEELPIRLCYTGNTFINHSSYQGRLREVTQMGAEFIGDGSVEADAEMIALVIESMLTIGLKEFQVSVGNVEFFQSLIEDACLDEDAREPVSYTHLDVYKRQEMDDVYGYPYMRTYHPSYERAGGVPAISEVKFSLISREVYKRQSLCRRSPVLSKSTGPRITGRK